ncbi:hypothetical protein ACFQRL_14320 [Microbacterium fluvii]|uniref:Uncharacterized protein n=1 Tax=Microbacterium fluvii TaxID=415215 RepID=A0ABW2HG56_9MICO|nr:hypothetical protein [Microbacterium fluvii]MCU4673766.1 hypothetical protein [Microbacterium fluvii]
MNVTFDDGRRMKEDSMKRFVQVGVSTLVGLTLAVTATTVAPSAALATTDDEERASFVASASEIMGWSEAEAQAAWADPDIRAITPTDVITTTTETDSRPAASDRAALAKEIGAVAAAATQQKTISTTRKYTGIAGTLFSLTSKKTFLYNGVRVWHDAVIVSYTQEWWSFDSMVLSTDQYGAIGGVANSKTVSQRAAKFYFAVTGEYLSIGITQEGRYNGVTNWSTW